MDYGISMDPMRRLLLLLMLAAGLSYSNGQDEVTTTTILPSSFPVINDYSEDIVPKTVVTIVAFTAAILLGMVVAKIVEYCLERASISDNASDMSDYTRNLLKAQLMLAFNKGKKDKKQKPEDIAKKFGKLWFGKTSRNKARRLKAAKAEAEKDKQASGNFLKVPAAKSSPTKTPVVELKVIDETKKRGNKSSTVTPPTTTSSSFGRDASTRASNKAPHGNSVAPVEATKAGSSGQTSNANNNAKDKAQSSTAQSDASASATQADTGANTKADTTTNPSSPTKPPVKATVNKTNVGSRPVSAGLKKPGVARPVSSKAPRPPTAKARQTKN